MAIFIQNRQELEQRLVIMKTQDGWSIRALARHFTVSRNMVRRILRKHEKLRDQGHDILIKDRQVRKKERASKQARLLREDSSAAPGEIPSHYRSKAL